MIYSLDSLLNACTKVALIYIECALSFNMTETFVYNTVDVLIYQVVLSHSQNQFIASICTISKS